MLQPVSPVLPFQAVEVPGWLEPAAHEPVGI